MPNGTSIHSSHMSDLLLTVLPPCARKVHILLGLVQNMLLSVGRLQVSGCDITFTKEKVTVMKDRKCEMLGSRNPHSRLWRVNLKEEATPVWKSECNHAHDTSSQKELINDLHAAPPSPVELTWITAIKHGFFNIMPRINGADG
jgi:hypothetical protein